MRLHDHKRHSVHSITDPSSSCNQQHLITCSEMRDVWINEIGPKLDAIAIVRLSMVNNWAHHVAHNIKQHCGLVKFESISKCRDAIATWPDLRLKLKLLSWSTTTNEKSWCDVVSLNLVYCPISDFSFVETRRLERFRRCGVLLMCLSWRS
eukprot:c13185_g2_i2.p1 GENE.c13185_g2_i2~~c13185_g2_i2.p1  ORF type:complete len:151 (-),score=31.51 c13185_g2_i2:637-1089(-)